MPTTDGVALPLKEKSNPALGHLGNFKAALLEYTLHGVSLVLGPETAINATTELLTGESLGILHLCSKCNPFVRMEVVLLIELWLGNPDS